MIERISIRKTGLLHFLALDHVECMQTILDFFKFVKTETYGNKNYINIRSRENKAHTLIWIFPNQFHIKKKRSLKVSDTQDLLFGD